MSRIQRLRQHALTAPNDSKEWAYWYYKGFLESRKETRTLDLRYAKAIYTMLSNVEPVIDPDELIVGKQSSRALTPAEEAEYTAMETYTMPAIVSDYQGAHIAMDYEKLLSKGIVGMREEIDQHLAELDPVSSEDMEKEAFYRAAKLALAGMQRFSERYSEYAAQLADGCSDPVRRAELRQIADNCAAAPLYPAQTFHQALQACHTLTICVARFPFGLFQLGRPDRFLYPYYERDIAQGRLTREEALTLINCFCILYNEYVQRGLAVGFMVGGKDRHGNNTANELTYLFIESISHTKLIYPGIGLACNQDTPEDLLRLAAKTLGEGHSHPALFNDTVIREGLAMHGVSEEDLYDYVQSTCVEITPGHSSASWVASPYVNLMQLLLDVLNIQENNRAATSFGSFEALLEAYFSKLKATIRENFIHFNKQMLEVSQGFRNPLLSCFIDDCIARGKDIEAGGARYNWIMPSFVGVANLADAFEVIRTFIFEKKSLTFERMAEILRADFVGYEAERQTWLNHSAKYGNDIDRVDGLVEQISEKIVSFCQGYTNCRGGHLVSSLFCWIMHEQLGTKTMATPDGRKKGFPFGDGSGPAQGREVSGPTASILSSTKWNHVPFVGGIAVNMKFSKKLFQEESIDQLLALFRVFLQRGGFELQINCVDQETLRKAQEHPEQYADLVVRIGGYSDYFVKLSKEMQAEVMLRTGHML